MTKMRPALFLFLSLALSSGLAQATCTGDSPQLPRPYETALADFAAQPGNTIEGPYTPEEVERKQMIAIRGTDKVLPFGNLNEKWRVIRESMVSTDELYFVVRRKGIFYMDGHVLVRDGCIINFLMGKMR